MKLNISFGPKLLLQKFLLLFWLVCVVDVVGVGVVVAVVVEIVVVGLIFLLLAFGGVN